MFGTWSKLKNYGIPFCYYNPDHYSKNIKGVCAYLLDFEKFYEARKTILAGKIRELVG